MADSGIRVGYISTYNAEAGTATIYYPDRSNDVTAELPIFSPCGLLQVLKKGDQVLVLHLPTGSAAGFIMGECLSDGDVPKTSVYADNDSLTLKDPDGVITLRQVIALMEKVDLLQAKVNELESKVEALG
jgi:hypothetical protein